MKIFYKIMSFSLAVFVLFCGTASFVEAASPTLTLFQSGSGVQLTAYGDPNAPIQLDYYDQSYGFHAVGVIGSTNYSGYFSTYINNGTYGIGNNDQVFVIIDGQQSPSVVWPEYGNYGGNPSYNTTSVSFSQSAISLYPGQSTTISIYGNNNYGSYYFSGSPSSSIATASLSGNTITVQALSYGSTIFTVCSSYGYGCGSFTVSVATNYYNNGSNYYYPGNTTYPNYGYPNGNGYSSCYYYSYTNCCGTQQQSGAIFLSPSSINVGAGQTQIVTITGSQYYANSYTYGYSGNYYISANSNPTSVSASVNGNTVYVTGIYPGTATISVCSAQGGCSTLVASVIGQYPYYYGGY